MMGTQTKGYRDYVFETITALNKRTEDLCKNLSQKDLAQEDVLHYIEFSRVDAIGRTKLYNKLKEIREERREIKEEYERMQSASNRLKDILASTTPHRTYEPRVIQLSTIVGKKKNKTISKE